MTMNREGVSANGEKVFGPASDTPNPHCIIIPTCIHEIAEDAFLDLESLQSIYIAENVKRIGTNAFKGTTLINVIINDAIETIVFRNENGDIEITLHKPFSALRQYLREGYEARLFRAGEDISWD